jgi:hypothetical protein
MGKTTRNAIGAAIVLMVAIGIATDEGPLLLGNRDAHAIIGRPLTPMSYAGVARRTTRRAAYAGAYGGGYGYGYGAYAAPPVVAPTAVVSTLPAGCGYAGGIYTCGGAQYQPYYSGTTLVYRQM